MDPESIETQETQEISQEKTFISYIQDRNIDNLMCFCLFSVSMLSGRMAPWIQKALKHRKHMRFPRKRHLFLTPKTETQIISHRQREGEGEREREIQRCVFNINYQ